MSAGFDERQAEGVVRILGQAHSEVATKGDIELLKAEMVSLEQRLTVKLLTSQIALFLAIAALAKYLTA